MRCLVGVFKLSFNALLWLLLQKLELKLWPTALGDGVLRPLATLLNDVTGFVGSWRLEVLLLVCERVFGRWFFSCWSESAVALPKRLKYDDM